MTDPRGSFKVAASGKTYTLWGGMSVFAALQAKYGNDVLAQLDPPEGAEPNWIPNLGIVVDLVVGTLERFHADEANRFTADEIIAENGAADLLPQLLAAAFPDADAGNGKPKRAKAG